MLLSDQLQALGLGSVFLTFSPIVSGQAVKELWLGRILSYYRFYSLTYWAANDIGVTSV